MTSSETKLCIYNNHYSLPSKSIDIMRFVCVISQLLCFFSCSWFKTTAFCWCYEKQTSQPRLNGNDFVSKVTTFGPRRERTKANSMRCLEKQQLWLPKTSNPLDLKKLVRSHVFRAIFVDSKGGVQIVTAWPYILGISSLKDSLFTVTLFGMWFYCRLLQRSGQVSMSYLKTIVVAFRLVGMQQKSRLRWEESRKHQEFHWPSETGLASKNTSNKHQQSKLTPDHFTL